MGRLDDTPGCVNQIHLGGEGRRPEPTQICSCAAGLIHMHDCPVTLGLECAHFRHREGEPEAVSYPDYEQLHERLMQEFLSRSYFHRIRVLSPEGDPWQRRREHLVDEYRSEPEDAEEPAEEEEKDYERERERLIRKRKEREEARRERDDKSREERAQERARMGIKTVVEKARETVAQQGNVMSSILDEVKLPSGGRKRRRPRRRGPGKAPEEGAPPQAGQGQPQGGKKRRRRRRRRKGNRPPDGGSA